MHYHHAYWSVQAPLSCFLSWRLIFTSHALGQYGLAGQVVWILSWTSMRHTYLIVANWSALQWLTSLHPWAPAFWSALRKSTWPHHWVPAHVSTVLWHACQLHHDITLSLGWKSHHDWWWQGPVPFARCSAWCFPWPRKVTSPCSQGGRWLQQGHIDWGRNGECLSWQWYILGHGYRLPIGWSCCCGCWQPQSIQWCIAVCHCYLPCSRHSKGMWWGVR